MSRCPHCNQDHAATNHFCPVTGAPIPLGSRLLSSKLLDKYTVVRVLGEGPIGVVLEVEDVETRQHFAAKVIHPRYTRDPGAAKSFMEDVVRLQSILNINIARIVQVGRDAGAAIVVIRELMNGECLALRLQRLGRFSVQEAISVVREILGALQALHQSAVINLDLSPSDIFLVPGPTGPVVKMLDIGERHIKAALPSDAGRPDSYNYFAPEQLDRSRQPNLRSDFYAVGVMLYQMLAGAVPSGAPEPLTVLRSDVPPDLARIASKASASMPNNRYQSAAEFIHDLDSITWSATPSQPAAAADASSGAPNEPVASAESSGSGPHTALAPAASVIVEMPEIQTPSSKKKLWVIAVLSVVLACAGGAAVYFGGSTDGRASQSVEIVEITIDVVPADATVQADGKRVDGNPPVLRVPMDADLHTISAKSNGYEALERDVRYDRSKVVKIELMEIIQPDEPAPEDDEPPPRVIPSSAPAVSPTAPAAPRSPAVGGARTTATSDTGKPGRRAPGAGNEGAAAGKSKRTKKADTEKAAASTDKKSTKKSRSDKNEEGFRVANPFE